MKYKELEPLKVQSLENIGEIDEHGIVSKKSQGMIDFAYQFAKKAHGDQKRKYTGEPYIVHPICVAQWVSTVTEDCDMIAAAFLHDVIEDTDITLDQIRKLGLGFRVVQFVTELTEFSIPKDGNRAFRKMLDRRYLERASSQAQTIKLADLIDNSCSIIKYDPDFAKIYIKEKQQLLEVLTRGDPKLYNRAVTIIDEYYKNN